MCRKSGAPFRGLRHINFLNPRNKLSYSHTHTPARRRCNSGRPPIYVSLGTYKTKRNPSEQIFILYRNHQLSFALLRAPPKITAATLPVLLRNFCRFGYLLGSSAVSAVLLHKPERAVSDRKTANRVCYMPQTF